MIQHTFTRTALLAAIMATLSGCVGDDDDNIAPQVENVTVASTTQFQPTEGQVPANDPNRDDLTFTASVVADTDGKAPGEVTIDNTGHFVYTPFSNEAATINVTVSDGELETSSTITIASVAGDPLADQQWHIRNTGQKAFSQSQEFLDFLVNVLGYPEDVALANFFDESILVAGEDMNVVAAYQQGALGQGMVVGVVDSGLEITHPDLDGNIEPGLSLNLRDDATNLNDPTSLEETGDHGTSVSGLIAAEAGNGMGGRGVAPEAKVFGVNYLGGPTTQTQFNELLSHGVPGSGVDDSVNLIAYNRSYGISVPFALYYSDTTLAAERYVNLELRQGKGAVNVKSAGNAFDYTGNAGYFDGICEASGATTLGLTCLNGNTDPENASFWTVSVAAVNSDGRHTSYSTAGANIFVSAPAGEYGYAAPAMVTTDQATCLRGYSSFPAQDNIDASTGIPGYFAGLFPFNAPGYEANPRCNYTSTFNGTSSAAPNTSGVIALIGSANPQLSAREIRHIIANTADQVDPNDEPVVITIGDGAFVADPGWVENAAGYHFNLKYGFGRINAGEAVKMAKAQTAGFMPALIEGHWMDVSPATALDVPDNDADGASLAFEVTDDMVLEGVQFRLTVSNADLNGCNFTTAGNDLAIEVTSPSGTTTQLLSGAQALNLGADGYCSQYILEDTLFLANAFYGESAVGEWTIRLVDVNGDDYQASGYPITNNTETFANNSVPSQLEAASVRFYGHAE
ncbi:serine protease [Idiomarina tyrosinivorans]|uniref:Serine protease n=1 Tax=Idiomarina tyrosinivorans TaxID=1445662 RepID=A0A432ZQX7_9GAMM|nr:S8 family serine peptidase [Idiomarina tyrosinivorans]RUO80252.1 serine protease [Idiomarina tyrosinivorans]